METERIGIHFEFPRNYTTHLAYLFESVDVEKYTWYADYSESYYAHDGTVDPFLPKGVYSGKEFSELIHETPEYYIHLLRLLAVPRGMEFDPDTVSDYQVFSNSPAEIALLSADSFVDFYAKDPLMLEKVMESCERHFNEKEEPYYLTPQNDERYGFFV